MCLWHIREARAGFFVNKDVSMSKLTVDQKTILLLLSDPKCFFVVPDYQRPYAWESERECQVLWDDIMEFAFPEDNADNFKKDDYFLGPIVVYKNTDNNDMLEVIDGQQRLTTIMLLLRAIYEKISGQQDEGSQATRRNIEKCLWDIDEVTEKPNKNRPKLESNVATDEDKIELTYILETGKCETKKPGLYAKNYNFFQKKLDEFFNNKASYFQYLPTRLLKNCVLLPIEADSQDTALRIFSTLNDRGKPLADSDIFKAQFYKRFKAKNKKDKFIAEWKLFEKTCVNAIGADVATSTNEIFNRYMYYVRACKGVRDSTTKGLRKFYEENDYQLLTEETFENLKKLADFWAKIKDQNLDFIQETDSKNSADLCKRLYILNNAPNDMWTNITSVYFMKLKDKNDKLDARALSAFFDKITAFIWLQAVVNPGVSQLRTPVYAEMIKIINSERVTFSDYQTEERVARSRFEDYLFSNNKPITKSMLCWWIFHNDTNQTPLDMSAKMQIEHIYARNRNEKENSLSDAESIEKLGNKSMLESSINIAASDYRFTDKVKYYKGLVPTKKRNKQPTQIKELISMCSRSDFSEEDILCRNKRILDAFFDFLRNQEVIK